MAASAAPLEDLSGGQAGRIEFNSSTPDNIWEMVRGAKTVPVVVWGDLTLPRSTTQKYPVMVMSHGSDGAVNNSAYPGYIKALNDAGVAVFMVDTYTPRGFDKLTPEGRLNQNLSAHVSDSLNALRLLATHPNIDPNKIFHMGWSTGGNTVMAAAFPAFMRKVVSAPLRWAGSIALYPGCNNKWRVDHLGKNPAPILMLLGAKDDMTPSNACVDYAKTLVKDGSTVSYKVYPDAYHVFDRVNQPYAQFKEGNFAKCNVEVKMSLTLNGVGDGYDYNLNRKIVTGSDLNDSLKECRQMSYISVQSNPKATQAAVQDVLDFVKNN